MNVLQKLKIKNKRQFLDLILEKNQLASTWTRNKAREENINKDNNIQSYCFDYDGNLPKAKLWIIEQSNFYELSNIVPAEKHMLEKNEYNAILNEFIMDNIADIEYEVSKSNISLSDIVQADTAKQFYNFSRAANKSTGSSHPLDKERWLNFIFSCVVGNTYVYPEYLRFFLKEDGWDTHSAIDLSLEYESIYEAMKFSLEKDI